MKIPTDIFVDVLRFAPKEIVYICGLNRVRIPALVGLPTNGVILESLEMPSQSMAYVDIPFLNTTTRVPYGVNYSNLILNFKSSGELYETSKSLLMKITELEPFSIILEELNPMNDVIYKNELYACHVSAVDWMYEDRSFKFKLDIRVNYMSSVI